MGAMGGRELGRGFGWSVSQETGYQDKRHDLLGNIDAKTAMKQRLKQKHDQKAMKSPKGLG